MKLNPVQHDIIIELQAENERLKSENARLAAAIETEPELPGPVPEVIAQFYELNPEEACRAVVRATKKSIRRRAKSYDTLRDLLSPVGSLLTNLERVMRYEGRNVEADRCLKQLARLRAACGDGKEQK